MIDFEDDAVKVESLPAEKLSLVSKMARQISDFERQLAAIDANRKDVAERLRVLTEESLPEAMNELGLTELRLDDGSRLSVATSYHASIPEAKKPDAFIWLREHGHDSLIKHEFTLNFGKGEDEAAVRFDSVARSMGYEPREKVIVHPQTLRAFVREQVEQGTPVPEDLFGVHIINKAQIRR